MQRNRQSGGSVRGSGRAYGVSTLVGSCLLSALLTSVGCSTSSETASGVDSGASGGSAGSGGGSAGAVNPGIGGNLVVDVGGGGGATSLGTTEQPPPSALPEGGEVFSATFNEADKAKFDGEPSPSSAPTVAYPLAGALFPANLAPVEVHLTKANAAQSIARVTFHVEGFDLTLYDTCAPAGASETDETGCIISIPADVCKKLGDANYFGALTTTVRLADADGGNVGEAVLENVAWTYSTLTGGLYYWTTIGPSNTAIKRYDFSKATDAPEVYWAQTPDSPVLEGAKAPAGNACMGCHALSRDGTKIAMSFGGSKPAAFELIDVATKEPIAARLDADQGYASMSSFSPDNSRIINSFRGKLLLREATETLADVTELFTTDTPESKSHPFWSPTGERIAFVSFNFVPVGTTDELTGDVVPDSQIWTAPSDGKAVTGPATLLVARAAGKSSYYPAISNDGKFVVFNQSTCSGIESNEWGGGSCDGYNDFSARLLMVPVEGGAPVDLGNANGSGPLSNSWPRWSPDRGHFGKQPVYWVAFSSRRPYGLRLKGGASIGIKPQLWFAAVRATPGQPLEVDPSFAPVWLPGQNENIQTPTGNHIPQWVEKAVPIVVK